MMKNTLIHYLKNKKQMLLFLFGVILCSMHLEAKNQFPRKTVNLNREWKYMRGDYKEAAFPDFEDRDWETTGLPHSFSIPYFMSNDFYVGYGWYRKKLVLTEKELSHRLFLEFDGIFQEAEIFINGKLIKRHVRGYTGFNTDISPAVKNDPDTPQPSFHHSLEHV